MFRSSSALMATGLWGLLFVLSSTEGVWAGPTTPNPGLRYYYPLDPGVPLVDVTADIVVYGASSGGAVAAVQARRMGKSVVLVEFGRHVGGMTSGGLSETDGVSTAVQGGLCREFFNLVGKDRGFTAAQAEAAFNNLLANPLRDGDPLKAIPVFFEQRLASVEKTGERITAIHMENGSVFRGSMFIDATYEGDLMAKAGVTYTVGREANATYAESKNGKQTPKVITQIDPYVVPGNSSSGLLKGISAEAQGTFGTADDHVMAYCFRLWVERNSSPRLPWPKPANYDAARYEILYRYLRGGGKPDLEYRKHDMNNHKMFDGVVSLNNVDRSRDWAEATYADREILYQDHVTWEQGLFWYCANDPQLLALTTDMSVSSTVRSNAAATISTIQSWGLPTDQYPDTGGWPRQLYIREARRMISDLVMTEANYNRTVIAPDSVGLANYVSDSHDVRRIVVGGKMANEGNTGGGIVSPWRIAYRSIVPAQGECENLLVPWCVSATHVAFGSYRMEPVLMVVGQSAATAAALAIDAGVAVQDLDYSALRTRLLADGQILGADPSNQPPVVTLTAPANGANFQAGANILLEAAASDPDGNITKVEFYDGGTKLGEATSAPYAFLWTGVPAGNHSLVARATDDYFANATSSAVAITVIPSSSGGTGSASDGIIIDNADPAGVSIVGEWTASSHTPGFYGTDYLTDGNTGQGAKTVAFTPALPVAGIYRVYLRWTAHTNRATNVPVDVTHADGTTPHSVNQQISNGEWVLLGTYPFRAGTGGRLIVRTDSANGHAIADAASFSLLGDPLPTISISATTPTASEYPVSAGSIRVSRTAPNSANVTVTLDTAGTALAGPDFAALPGAVTIPAGNLSIDLTVIPVDDSLAEGSESLTVSITPGSSYVRAELPTALLTILDRPTDEWKFAHFTTEELLDPTRSGDTADFDRDGLANLLERALSLDPKQPDAPGDVSCLLEDGRLSLRYKPVASDLDYIPEVSDTPAGPWLSGPDHVDETTIPESGQVKATDRTPTSLAPARFIQLRVKRAD